MRRKQSNRESARRSRLRKQAECELLAIKVTDLEKENSTLRIANGHLQEQVKSLLAQVGAAGLVKVGGCKAVCPAVLRCRSQPTWQLWLQRDRSGTCQPMWSPCPCLLEGRPESHRQQPAPRQACVMTAAADGRVIMVPPAPGFHEHLLLKL